MDMLTYLKAMQSDRVIAFNSEINDESVEVFRRQLQKMIRVESDTDIWITLTTAGGDVSQAVVMYQDIVLVNKACRVWLVCQSQVSSAGLYILPAVPKVQRLALSPTLFLTHQGEIAYGFSTDTNISHHEYLHQQHYAYIQKCNKLHKRLYRILAQATDTSEKKWKKYHDNPRVFFEKKAKKLGLIDHVL